MSHGWKYNFFRVAADYQAHTVDRLTLKTQASSTCLLTLDIVTSISYVFPHPYFLNIFSSSLIYHFLGTLKRSSKLHLCSEIVFQL